MPRTTSDGTTRKFINNKYVRFKLSLNSFPFCTRPHGEAIFDFYHIIFNCSSLLPSRLVIFSFLSSLVISPRLQPSPQLSFHSRHSFHYQLHLFRWLPYLIFVYFDCIYVFFFIL